MALGMRQGGRDREGAGEGRRARDPENAIMAQMQMAVHLSEMENRMQER